LVFEEEVELPSKTILERLHALPESPWADLHGKPLDQLSLAKRLRNYAVKPKTIRVAAGTLRGYLKSDLEDQWRRYLPPPREKAETSKTAETIPDQAVAGVAGVLAFPAMGRESSRCEHCHQPGDVVECHYGEASSWLHRDWMLGVPPMTGALATDLISPRSWIDEMPVGMKRYETG
jgi:hypothetical protein